MMMSLLVQHTIDDCSLPYKESPLCHPHACLFACVYVWTGSSWGLYGSKGHDNDGCFSVLAGRSTLTLSFTCRILAPSGWSCWTAARESRCVGGHLWPDWLINITISCTHTPGQAAPLVSHQPHILLSLTPSPSLPSLQLLSPLHESVKGILCSYWRTSSLESVRLYQIVKRLFNFLLSQSGQGLWLTFVPLGWATTGIL